MFPLWGTCRTWATPEHRPGRQKSRETAQKPTISQGTERHAAHHANKQKTKTNSLTNMASTRAIDTLWQNVASRNKMLQRDITA